jgi:hypothetical protein
MNISKAEIVRIKTMEDIIETEEGLLLKRAINAIKGFRNFAFSTGDQELQPILESLIKSVNVESKNSKK